jgi:transposase
VTVHSIAASPEVRQFSCIWLARSFHKTQYNYDKAIYEQRNIIELMFCRFKDWRHIATRFDRNLKTFMVAIALAAIVICWL